jgi:tRNA (adenine22-N1)-methyltransferase
LEALLPNEADTVLIAGMGGPLMERILSAYPATVDTVKELVLQPQSEVASLRRYLHENGFRITEEDMLCEDGKYYVIIRAEHGVEEPWTEEEYVYGKRLKKEAVPVLLEFLAKEREKTRAVLAGLNAAGTHKAENRKEEMLALLQLNEKTERRLTE